MPGRYCRSRRRLQPPEGRNAKRRIAMRSHPLPEGSPYLPNWAEISRIEQLTESEKLFELQLLDGSSLGHKPGQFVEISIMGIGEAPISVSSPPGRRQSFELAIRRIGN